MSELDKLEAYLKENGIRTGNINGMLSAIVVHTDLSKVCLKSTET